jgi:hypothetical protein
VSCNSLLELGSGVGTINWSVGTSSAWDRSVVAVDVKDDLVVVAEEGTITSGEFAGHEATGRLTFPPSSLDPCSQLGGLKSHNALATFEVLP